MVSHIPKTFRSKNLGTCCPFRNMLQFRKELTTFVREHPVTVVAFIFYSLFSITYLVDSHDVLHLLTLVNTWDAVLLGQPASSAQDTSVVFYFYAAAAFGFLVCTGNVIVQKVQKRQLFFCWVFLNAIAAVLLVLTVITIMRAVSTFKEVQSVCEKTEEELVRLYPPAGSEEMKVLTEICKTTVIYIPAAVSCILCTVLQVVLGGDLIYIALLHKNNVSDVGGGKASIPYNDSNSLLEELDDIEFQNTTLQFKTVDSEDQ